MAALTGKGSLLYSCKKKTGLGALLLNGAFIKGLLTLALPCFNLAGPMQLSFVLLTLPDLLPGACFRPAPGVAVNNANFFANVINSATSFNEMLWKAIGQCPNINVVHDQWWGRALETPGEDPYVVGRYTVNFMRGMQDVPGHDGGDPFLRPIKTHTRFDYDARVMERDMAETFLCPFEMCVWEGDASSVMCSFNLVNGVPACTNARLLSQTVRGDWGLYGYIVSDCDAVLTEDVRWLNLTGAEASAAAIRAGLDLDCDQSWTVCEDDGKMMGDFLSNFILAAVAQGKIRDVGPNQITITWI
ncbi:LOW QUALITY PROTEIN: hypothetical protein BDA96_08G107700 [Sorghum bicolor]|uniref:Glycoside hydrolase family 3 N-terminal domain-containing protein n=1 Tax=Sorghum bicolor TaxID=4558 RepID=A0A921QEK7_SORBI|nr:LOW QUALITY PROTEIN: hypothetical protein BDA96_08G107700 [Sorghum bicolor]